MTIEIDTDQVVEELTDDHTFTSWVDGRIDEHLPDEDRFVTTDSFEDALRNVIRNNGAAHFDLSATGHEHDHASDEEYLNQHLINVMDSLPRDSVERCVLGRAFERAVVKVLMNVLAGDQLVTHDNNLDFHLAAMVERVVPGAITMRTLDRPGYVVPAHTDEDGTDDPEPAYRAPTEQVYDFATRKCVEVYVNSALDNERVCDVVYEAMREQFGTRGNPSVTVESVGVQRLS